jgi:hypothetical protein
MCDVVSIFLCGLPMVDLGIFRQSPDPLRQNFWL